VAPGGGWGGVLVEGAVVVNDRRLITALSVVPVEFAHAVLKVLRVYEPAVLDAWYRLFGHQETRTRSWSG
jgi:hypothetical protein